MGRSTPPQIFLPDFAISGARPPGYPIITTEPHNPQLCGGKISKVQGWFMCVPLQPVGGKIKTAVSEMLITERKCSSVSMLLGIINLYCKQQLASISGRLVK